MFKKEEHKMKNWQYILIMMIALCMAVAFVWLMCSDAMYTPLQNTAAVGMLVVGPVAICGVIER